jgi:TonB family protein
MPILKPSLLWVVGWLACSCVSAQAPSRTSGGAQNTAHIYRVGHGVSAPVLIYKMEPGHTQEAKRAHLQGTVELSFVVAENGRAQNVRVIRSLGLGLDEKTIQAIQSWKFKPGRKDGTSVPVFAIADCNFCLPGGHCPASTSESSK